MTGTNNSTDPEVTEAKLDLSNELRDEELERVLGGNMRHETLKGVANNLRA